MIQHGGRVVDAAARDAENLADDLIVPQFFVHCNTVTQYIFAQKFFVLYACSTMVFVETIIWPFANCSPLMLIRMNLLRRRLMHPDHLGHQQRLLTAALRQFSRSDRA